MPGLSVTYWITLADVLNLGGSEQEELLPYVSLMVMSF